MKRSILVVLLIILSSFCFVACDYNYTKRELYVNVEDVATLTLFSDDGAKESNFFIKDLGHAFLAVQNISNTCFMVGDQPVEPNETITIGSWPVADHFGVWFNLESNYIKEYDKYSGRVSITIGVSMQDIETISDIIEDSDKWDPIFNCSKFALKVWNSVATENEIIRSKGVVSPKYLAKEIRKFNQFELNRDCITDEVVRFYKEA